MSTVDGVGACPQCGGAATTYWDSRALLYTLDCLWCGHAERTTYGRGHYIADTKEQRFSCFAKIEDIPPEATWIIETRGQDRLNNIVWDVIRGTPPSDLIATLREWSDSNDDLM